MTFPAHIQPVLRQLRRRLALGLFVEIWPLWAVGSLLAAGAVALVCRLFFANASGFLAWLWIAPLLAVIPAIVLCAMRAYRPQEIVALADALGGGDGTLIMLAETGDAEWAEVRESRLFENFAQPALRPWRRLRWVLLAAAFLFVALQMPQRIPARVSGAMAAEVANDLQSVLAELKTQELVTPEEEKKLEEEIERVRQNAMERMDSASWEAADTLREKMASEAAEKQDAMQWAQKNLASLGAAGANGLSPAQSAEIAKAIERLAQAGLLNSAPPDLQKLLGGKDALGSGRPQMPGDPRALAQLAESLSEYLAKRGERMGDLARLGRRFGRFNPEDFPLAASGESEKVNTPGNGDVTRGRGDADLTWGEESWPYDRFKPIALPPGQARNPDEWTPVAELPGAPQEAPEASVASTARTYVDAAGQAAWRRTLAPRHQSAVKKYFGIPSGTPGSTNVQR